jgi:excisionase family DNA binding protein
MNADVDSDAPRHGPREGAPEIPLLLTVRQVAELLNCSVRHIRRLADRGAMPQPVRIGALVRWERAELARWIEGGCRPVRATKGAVR